MPLWKMEQITPYFEKEGNHTKENPIGTKLVKDCLTGSEIGIVHILPLGHSYNGEKVTTPTIIAHTIVRTSPVYREESPDMNSFEKAAKKLYTVYWRNLSFWGSFIDCPISGLSLR